MLKIVFQEEQIIGVVKTLLQKWVFSVYTEKTV